MAAEEGGGGVKGEVEGQEMEGGDGVVDLMRGEVRRIVSEA